MYRVTNLDSMKIGKLMELEKKNKISKKKYWPLLASTLIILVGFGLFQILNSELDAGDMSSVTVATIRTGDIRVSAIGSGTLIASEEVEFGFENSGVIEEILVVTGDYVEEGQVLARLDDEKLIENLVKAQAELRELTSEASVAAAALEIAEAQKAVLSAESELSFLISPYVYLTELRLRNAEQVLRQAELDAELNPSDDADQRIAEAQGIIDHAALSLMMNWETYAEEYVPDFFNFPWRDRFGFWHDYFDPPSETEIALARAELTGAEARVEEGEAYLVALIDGEIPEDAYGSQLVKLEKYSAAVSDAKATLEESVLIAPIGGVIVELNIQELEKVGTKNVMTIAHLEPPTVEASFDEGDWSLVKVGMPVEVEFDSLPEKIYQGQIVFVDPTLQTRQNTTTVSALVELDITQTGWADLPLSSTATVEAIVGEAQNAILLPVEGLQEENEEQGLVYLIQNDGEKILVEVDLGLRDVLFVEITGGLSEGDVVLIGSNQ